MPPPPSVSDDVGDWRSSRPLAKIPEPDEPPVRRRGSGFSTTDGQPSLADKEEHWSIGSKFKASVPDEPSAGRFGSLRGRYESLHGKDDDTDWRSARPPRTQGGTSRKYIFSRVP